jgi:membrane protease YdiL (CAAX protease family)
MSEIELGKPGPGLPPSPHERPWWSPVDVVLANPFVLVSGLIGALIGLAVSALAGYDTGGDFELPTYGLFIAVLAQQLGQGAWPWIVSKRKGLGLVSDWRFSFDLRWSKIWLPRDILLGLGLAVVSLIGTGIATVGVSALVGLDDPGEASNTTIISDNEGSLWLIGVIALVVIGAPLTEELLFRGLFLRVFERSFGGVVAVIGSTLLFTLPHIQGGATWRESVVLLSAIATIGLVLGIGALRIGRLGPTIIAHFLFNAFGTAAAIWS